MQPQPGDHIYGARKGGLYHHHGIYAGNDRVIHMTAPCKQQQSYSPECQNCGYKGEGEGGLVETCLSCFLDGYSLRVYEYGVPYSVYKKKLRGTCSVLMSKPAHEVIQTARDLLKRGKNGFGKYNLITNNCENFAVYCKTGSSLSEEVQGHVENGNRVVSDFLSTLASVCGALAVGGVVAVGTAYSIAKK